MRILIVKLSSLGDLFHALPAVHCLKTQLGAGIDWVARAGYADLVRCFRDVDRVIPFPRREGGRLASFLRELRRETYDRILDLQGLLKSAVIARLARGGERIGPSFHREGAWVLYSAVAGRRNKNRHAVEENLDVVRYLGLAPGPVRFPVDFPACPVDRKRPRVALLPAARWPTKRWPPECFAAAGGLLRRNLDASLFLIGGTDAAAASRRIEGALDGEPVNLAGRLSLPETGGLLKEMDLLIANDTGPVHMAAAVGTPALVVFGPTDPVRTGPYGEGHRVVHASLPCRPCFSRTCRRPGIPCLRGVTPERVAETAMKMLQRPLPA